MNDTYCCLTKLGLSTQNEGYVTICNQSRVHFRDKDNNLIRLDKHDLDTAWNSPTRKEIDVSLSNGIRHSNCQDCWNEEDAGRISKRQIHNKELFDVEPSDFQPKVILLKPGNICNLACRHCSPYVSSGWYRDSYKLDNKNKTYYDWVKNFQHIKKGYDSSNDGFWNILNNWTPNLVYYDLYGGEPLLVEELYNNLKYSVDNNYSKNQIININTNGTIWQDEFNFVFSKFKYVIFDISADGIHEQFEYMRYPAKWNNFYSNLNKYKLLAHDHENIKLGITITVSLYNIFYLPEMVSFYQSLGIKYGINILHTPDYLNMRIAPKKLKDIITEKLNDDKFKAITNFLNTDIDNQSELYAQFLLNHKKIDDIRDQKYEDCFPEMAKYLNDRFI